MAELLAMDVVNVPTYDGYQATATALSMAGRMSGRRRILVASDVLPAKLSKVRDFVRMHLDLDFVPTIDGVADVAGLAERLGDDVAAVWIETPSCTGALEARLREIADAAHASARCSWWAPTRSGTACSPRRPNTGRTSSAATSSRSVCTSGSAAPTVGSSPVHDDPRFIMEMPSRLFGLATTDVPGEYGFGDVAYDRTSFAHREEGKEWVGTAAALWGIASGVYLALMGPQGMRDLGEVLLARTRYAQLRLAGIPGVVLGDTAMHLREFTIDVSGRGPHGLERSSRPPSRGIEPGVPVGEHRLLVCVTEMTSQADIDRLVVELAELVSGAGLDTRAAASDSATTITSESTPILEEQRA
jgi:glycine dehydrogenase subunit 1